MSRKQKFQFTLAVFAIYSIGVLEGLGRIGPTFGVLLSYCVAQYLIGSVEEQIEDRPLSAWCSYYGVELPKMMRQS